jgi:hypothetical protein
MCVFVSRPVVPDGPAPEPVPSPLPAITIAADLAQPSPLAPWYARDSTEMQLIAIAVMVVLAFELPRMGVWVPPPCGF